MEKTTQQNSRKDNPNEINEKIQDIISRGVVSFVDPNGVFTEKLRKKALGEDTSPLIVKFGVDPTRPDIHLGHAVALRKLRQLQDLGCKVVFLAGDFTAQIGDPTGKSKVRPEVDQQQIQESMESYVRQIPKLLTLKTENDNNAIYDKNQFIVDSKCFGWIRNSDWYFGVTDIDTRGVDEALRRIPIEPSKNYLASENSFIDKAVVFSNTRMQKMFLNRDESSIVTFATFLSILRKISFSQLIERDMFQDRINSNEPLFMHEMVYPILQGIDSDVIAKIYRSCDLEIGGSDQTFNMLMGRRIMEITNTNTPQATLAVRLLVGLDGKEKMSKSLDNYIGVTDAPADMYGKVMSIPDAAIPEYLELATYSDLATVALVRDGLASGTLHPKKEKMRLARQIVEIYHGREKAEEAERAFENVFAKGEIPNDVRTISVAKGTLLADALATENVVASKSEFRRLIDEGAIAEMDGEKITDPFVKIERAMTLRIGKKRFLKIDCNG
ncbi:MAG TPA: tyrosine--tRNA ligase [Candidatus Paceibacterota bacterium]|nr:tyrosine--tRNA ligase [Candidatus Paceibacterota bacterium]